MFKVNVYTRILTVNVGVTGAIVLGMEKYGLLGRLMLLASVCVGIWMGVYFNKEDKNEK